MSERIERAQGLLQEQLAELDAEEQDLRQALASLDGAPNRAPQKATRGPVRRRAPKRAKKGQRLEEVSAILKANPNAKTVDIAKQIGISTNQVSGLRKRVATSGALKKAPAQKQKPKRAKRKAAKAPAKKAAKAAKKENPKKAAAKAAKPGKKKAAKPKARAANKKGGAKRGKGASSSRKSPTPKPPKSN